MRTGITVFAALFAASLVATPLVLSGTRALATQEETAEVTLPAAVLPVEVAPVAAPQPETCARKVRVVYSGYGAPVCAQR